MKKVFILLIILSLTLVSCVIDYTYPMHVTNHTNDTILIGFGRYNIIDSTKRFMPSDTRETLAFKGDTVVYRESVNTIFNGKGKLSIGKDDLIKLETARKHTWEEICRDTLYDTIIITQDMLKQGIHFDYWGNDSISVVSVAQDA